MDRVLRGWLRRSALPPHLREAERAFRDGLERLEAARDALLAAVPGGRGSLVPLAEALAAFEAGVAGVRESLERWRAPEVLSEWEGCRAALEEAARRAEALRLGAEGSENYEEVYGPLGDLLEPLSAFDEAARAFRRLGRGAVPASPAEGSGRGRS